MMNKEEMKAKVKNLWEEHKLGIVFTGGYIAATAVIMVGGKIYELKHGKDTIVVHEGLKSLITDVQNRYEFLDVFTGYSDTPLNVDELGKLGEKIKECPNFAGETFTHFLAVGEHKK